MERAVIGTPIKHSLHSFEVYMLPFAEWCKLNIERFPYGQRVAARKEYIRQKQEEEKMKNPPELPKTVPVDHYTTKILDMMTGYSDTPYSLACNACPAPETNPWPVNQQEGNNPMNYASATVQAGTTETQDQRKYLEKRLNEVYHEKRDPLEAEFGLIDDEPPSDVSDFQKRITDGAYSFRTGDKYRYWHWTDLLQWRHPDRKRDDEGFKAALDALKAEKQKALDIIKIEEPKAGLDAIKALEAWTPTGKAN